MKQQLIEKAERIEKRDYVKPQIVCEREIEAITGMCETGGQNTMQDKLSFDPSSGMCMNPMT